MASLLIPAIMIARDITGAWSGRLDIAPRNSLKIVFHIYPDSVTMDSPDQNAYGIKGEIKHLSPDTVNVGVARLLMNYAGKLTGDSIVGTFRQGAFSVPLTLHPGVEKANRPQTPQPPFPYSTEDVVITSPDAVLAGTLTIPEGATSSTPAVVLVSGSGLQNRDEELFEHKPFAVIADYLARNGIASLRYDDRGYGMSKGDNGSATTADYASDAEAVARYLRESGRFSKIGLVGHSEGGMIGYILGARPDVVDFVVSIAGPSVRGAEINAWQNRVALIESGVDSITAEAFSEALLKAMVYRLENPPLTTVTEATLGEMYPQYADSPVTQKLGETIKATLTMATINPWMEYFLRFDPAPDLKHMKSPAFIIYGEKDLQVPPSLNYEPAVANAPEAVVRIYPGLNHLMQHAATGSVNEYKEIEETISPEVLSDIVSFILSVK